MLHELRQIVQEVNEAQDLSEALFVMVQSVSEAIKVEACSVYLADKRYNHYRLIASVGFNAGVDGQVTLGFSEGLIGLVGEREEPINLHNAQKHPRYRYYPETGEERYEAFLGVPIIHQRRLVGILVAQQREKRKFDEGEEAFLVTISAQLSGIIAHAQTAGMINELWQEKSTSTLHGIGASFGVAIGSAVATYIPADLDKVPDKKIEEPKAEVERFFEALAATIEDIKRLRSRLKDVLPVEEQSLFDAYLRILESKTIVNEIIELIEQNHWAPWALRKVIKRHVRSFEAMEDEYLRERASDVLDLGRRLLSNLQAQDKRTIQYHDDTIIVGEELTASCLAEVPEGKLLGIVSAKGSANSHVAILAKAMGIPAVMGATGLPIHNIDNKQIIVDGYNGEILISPTPAMEQEYRRLALEEQELYAGLNELKELRAETPDGVRMPLCVNTGLIADIRPSVQVGAEGIGLYRTEIPFMIRDRFPAECEQYDIYRQLLENFAPKPVVIRTLDIGGDKTLPYFPFEEENPYLGWRGIRLTLDHPEIFLLQLRALLRANYELNNLKILLPMVSSLSEIDEALRLIRQAHREIHDEGLLVDFPPVGVMIEVPSTVYQAHSIAKKVDFLSVGSNDLTQYLLAVDRNNSQVAGLYDSLHPAVLHALKLVIEAGHEYCKPVSICGEMAGDPASVVALLGLGFDMLSMSATNLPKVKWIIRNFTKERARMLLEEVMIMDNPTDIRLHLEGALEAAGLGGLVRAGK